MFAEVVIRQREVPQLAEPVHENALLHRILAARGIRHCSDHSFSLADIPSPQTLPDITPAVDRLLSARESGERVLVVGDYDCDGATSTAVAMLGLHMLGFRQLDYVIPNRFDYGYGLSPAIVDLAVSEYKAQLIVTVDNGVASVDGVAHASAQGIDVVITDHHLAPELLPAAIAVVNPNIPGATFEGLNLAGVGVIFYTLLALRSRLKMLDDEYSQAALPQLLDLVAIGTVADVVPLDKLNRKLVEQGLRRIRTGHTRPGILALLEKSGRRVETISTQDIGFGIGPRLNAAGRIADMRLGVQCLLSETQKNAHSLAKELNDLNTRRRTIEGGMEQDAAEQLAQLNRDEALTDDTFAMCLKDERWHQGVIGILAGRLKEQEHKPVVVFTEDDADNLKGSARSITGVHIRDALQEIVARHPGMITKFGGHAMAAGLTLPKAHFECFKAALNEVIKQQLNGQHSMREHLTDGCLSSSERSLENAMLLANCMPWGQGFEAPLFCDRFRVLTQKEVGKGHLKLMLESEDSEQRIDAIAFKQSAVVEIGEWVRLVYALEANHFRNVDTLQLQVRHMEAWPLR